MSSSFGADADDAATSSVDDVEQQRINNPLSQHPLPVNESWRLCMERKWTALQMRLSRYPDEARQVQVSTRRSLLHEVVSAIILSEEAPCSSSISTSNVRQQEREVQRTVRQEQQEEVPAVDDDIIVIRPGDYLNDHVSGDTAGTHRTNNNAIIRRVHYTAESGVVSLLILRSVYFSCPKAMLLQDSVSGYTPLHSALASISTLTTSKATATDGTSNDASYEQQSSSSFDLISILLNLCQGRRDEEDSDSDWLEDEEEEEEDDIIGHTSNRAKTATDSSTSNDENEGSVLLIQDHLGDTPLHTACRHGCSKHDLHLLMKACPSALFQFNKDDVSPLGLLWSTLEKEMSNGNQISHVTPLAAMGVKASTAASASSSASAGNESAKEASSSRTLSELENILVNKIKHCKNLSEYPAIQDTWEKSMMLLHIHSVSLLNNKSDQEEGDGGGHVFHFASNEKLTKTQIESVLNNSVIDEVMPHEIYGNFLKRAPYLTMEEQPRDMKQSSNETTQTDSSNTGKRKRLPSLDATKHSSNWNKIEAKGVEVDENGMIPIPSYKSKRDVEDGQNTFSSYHNASALQSNYEDEINLFFQSDET